MLQLEAEGRARPGGRVPARPTDEMAERRADGAGMTQAGARRAARLREALDLARPRSESDLPDSRVPRSSTSRGTSRREIVDRFGDLLARAPAAAGAHRDDRVERRRELAGGHVRLTARRRDGRDARRGRPGVPDRARRDRRRRRGGTPSSPSTAKIDPGVQNDLMTGVDWLVETTSRWYLVQAPGPAPRRGRRSGASRSPSRELSAVIDQIGPEAWREEHGKHGAPPDGEGVPRRARAPPRVPGRARPRARHHPVSRATGPPGPRGRPRLLPARASGSRSTGSRTHSRSSRPRRDGSDGPSAVDGGRPVHDAPPDGETVLEQSGGSADRRGRRGVPRRTGSAAYGRVQRFMRRLAMEGVTDLSQLTVALRQLRSLVS